jgi:diacylglycerol kinase family enzyme
VAVLGGDGTLNEVANALAETDVPIAVLPGGGANILARALGIPNEPRTAAEWLAANPDAKPRRLPLGRVSSGSPEVPARWFVCNCGLGFDGAIVARVEHNQRAKRRAGDWFFVWQGLRLFVRGYDRRRPHVRLAWSGGERSGQYLAIVQNLSPFTYFGRRPLRICPEASPDGGLDCFAVDTMRTRTILPILVRAFGSARHTTNSHVAYLRDQSWLRISSDVPLPAQVDGEYLGERSVLNLESVPDALSFLC